MKRKILAGLLVAALSLSAAMSAFAASSGTTKSSSSSGGSSSGGGNSVSVATIDTTGMVTTTTTTTTTSLVTDDGVKIVNTEVGGVSLSFAVGAAETAGLTSSVVATINNINSGVSLNAAGTGLDLTGYNALVSTAALRTDSTSSGTEVNGPVTVVLYVPNLDASLGTVQVLYYDNFGSWSVIDPISVDYDNKQVTFTAPNSGTFTVIYK